MVVVVVGLSSPVRNRKGLSLLSSLHYRTSEKRLHDDAERKEDGRMDSTQVDKASERADRRTGGDTSFWKGKN